MDRSFRLRHFQSQSERTLFSPRRGLVSASYLSDGCTSRSPIPNSRRKRQPRDAADVYVRTCLLSVTLIPDFSSVPTAEEEEEEEDASSDSQYRS